jgi:hypothetical protein
LVSAEITKEDVAKRFKENPVLVTPDGEEKEFPPAGKTFTLEELQKAVRGYIEVLRLTPDLIAIINEEGWAMSMENNIKATHYVRLLEESPHLIMGHIAGPAVFMGSALFD